MKTLLSKGIKPSLAGMAEAGQNVGETGRVHVWIRAIFDCVLAAGTRRRNWLQTSSANPGPRDAARLASCRYPKSGWRAAGERQL